MPWDQDGKGGRCQVLLRCYLELSHMVGWNFRKIILTAALKTEWSHIILATQDLKSGQKAKTISGKLTLKIPSEDSMIGNNTPVLNYSNTVLSSTLSRSCVLYLTPDEETDWCIKGPHPMKNMPMLCLTVHQHSGCDLITLWMAQRHWDRQASDHTSRSPYHTSSGT